MPTGKGQVGISVSTEKEGQWTHTHTHTYKLPIKLTDPHVAVNDDHLVNECLSITTSKTCRLITGTSSRDG